MITPTTGTCRLCGATIVWAATWVLEDVPVRRKASRMPVDWPPALEQAPPGWTYVVAPGVPNCAVSQVGAGPRVRVLRVGQAPMADEILVHSHMATCPRRPGQPTQDTLDELVVPEPAGATVIPLSARRPSSRQRTWSRP